MWHWPDIVDTLGFVMRALSCPALIMVFVSVSFLPNGTRTVKELRIGLSVAALLDVIIGGSGFLDRPGRPARAAARAFELGPVA